MTELSERITEVLLAFDPYDSELREAAPVMAERIEEALGFTEELGGLIYNKGQRRWVSAWSEVAP